ncbi:MAG: AlkZ family DNA glycosylase [Anaerolineales bacterium]|jgi:hypothetical protein|nr:AlkZ family DNA glycosylase [Anaerolineales bacterium]
MKPTEIIRRRLANQHLAGNPLSTPLEVVAAQGAVQAQDFYGALWALAQRLPAGWTESAVEAWFADGRILRTHILRPTWHFVAPEDLRWMLLLSAPRVNAFNAYMYRQHGIDATTQKRALKALQRSLEGGRQLMRKELAEALEDSGIPIGSGAPGSIRLAHILMFAELAGLITSGPRRGKQFTYMLLDERAPAARRLPTRAEALAELARRYFGARGPASAHDFAWWSGLTLADCRAGAQAAGLHSTELDGKTYWWSEERAPANSVRSAWLLPNFDEYGIGFADRRHIEPQAYKSFWAGGNYMLPHFYIINGRTAGMWKRELGKQEVRITLQSPFGGDLRADAKVLDGNIQRYAKFLGLAAKVELLI